MISWRKMSWFFIVQIRMISINGGKPEAGSDVQFMWNHKGESQITKVFKNLLE